MNVNLDKSSQNRRKYLPVDKYMGSTFGQNWVNWWVYFYLASGKYLPKNQEYLSLFQCINSIIDLYTFHVCFMQVQKARTIPVTILQEVRQQTGKNIINDRHFQTKPAQIGDGYTYCNVQYTWYMFGWMIARAVPYKDYIPDLLDFNHMTNT